MSIIYKAFTLYLIIISKKPYAYESVPSGYNR